MIDWRQELSRIMTSLPQGGTPNVNFSGRQSANVDVGDSNFRPDRTDMEHISPG